MLISYAQFAVKIPPRGRTQQSDRKVQCYEPATMKYLGYFPALTPAEVSDAMLRILLPVMLRFFSPLVYRRTKVVLSLVIQRTCSRFFLVMGTALLIEVRFP